jgi:Family of unknown function (DUF5989)
VSEAVWYTAPVSKFSILGELWQFMRVRKKWWLLPLIMIIVLLGLILILAHGSPLAPFIYTIF